MWIKGALISALCAVACAAAAAEQEELAGQKICPNYAPTAWDQMPESAFSAEAAEEQMQSLRKYFAGEIEVAEEFIWQATMVLEGSFYRTEVERWRKDQGNFEYAVKTFCEFMESRARLVH